MLVVGRFFRFDSIIVRRFLVMVGYRCNCFFVLVVSFVAFLVFFRAVVFYLVGRGSFFSVAVFGSYLSVVRFGIDIRSESYVD